MSRLILDLVLIRYVKKFLTFIQTEFMKRFCMHMIIRASHLLFHKVFAIFFLQNLKLIQVLTEHLVIYVVKQCQ